MRQIQNTAQDAIDIKISGLKDNLQTDFNIANPVSGSVQSQAHQQQVYQEVHGQLQSLTQQLQSTSKERDETL